MATETKEKPQPGVRESEGESDVSYFSGEDDAAHEPQMQKQRENRVQRRAATATQERPQRRRTAAAQPEGMAMQQFEHARPPADTMGGPIMYAQNPRADIPMRERNQAMMQAESGKKDEDDDGLKLRLELNLDVEVELKASIHGDLTLALL
jgi:small subunit ribosomal protein S8e